MLVIEQRLLVLAMAPLVIVRAGQVTVLPAQMLLLGLRIEGQAVPVFCFRLGLN